MAEEKKSATAVDTAKQKKAEAAQRFKENKQKKAAQLIESAKALKANAEKGGFWNKLTDADRAFIEGLMSPKSVSGSSNSVLNILFGATPKVGDSITLADAFAKTYKGKATLDIIFNRYKKNGVIVEYTENPDVLKSTYTIKAL